MIDFVALADTCVFHTVTGISAALVIISDTTICDLDLIIRISMVDLLGGLFLLSKYINAIVMKCMTNKTTTEGADPAWRDLNQDLLCLIVFVTSI